MLRIIASFGSRVPDAKKELYNEMIHHDKTYIRLFEAEGEKLTHKNMGEITRFRMQKIAPLIAGSLSDDTLRRITYADELANEALTQGASDVTFVYDTILSPDWQPEDGEQLPFTAREYYRLLLERDEAIETVCRTVVLHYAFPGVAQAMIACFFLFRNMGNPLFLFPIPPPFGVEELANFLAETYSYPFDQHLPSDLKQGEEEFCRSITEIRRLESIQDASGSLSVLWKVVMDDSQDVVFKIFVDPTYLEDLQLRQNLTQNMSSFRLSQLYGLQYEAKVYREIIPGFDSPWFVRSIGYGRCTRSALPEFVLERVRESMLSSKNYPAYRILFRVYPNLILDFLATELVGKESIFRATREKILSDNMQIQLLHALYTMEKVKLTHNDLHAGNIRMEDGQFSYAFEGVNGVRRGFSSQSRIAIFDWDRAYCERLGQNPLLLTGNLEFTGSVNDFTPLADFFTIGYHFWRHSIPPFTLPCFADLYESIRNRKYILTPLSRLSDEGFDIINTLKDQRVFKVVCSEFPESDREIFRNMFFGHEPIWFRAMLMGEDRARRFLACSLFAESEHGGIHVFPNVQLADWPSLHSMLSSAVRSLPIIDQSETILSVDFEL